MSDTTDLWFSDGAGEFEGVLVKFDRGEFTARVRSVRRGAGSAGGMGKTLATSSLDLQRQFTNRRFLARVRGEAPGTLFQAAIHSVQRSSEDGFDYLLAGRMELLDEFQREAIRRGSWAGAAAMLRRSVS